MNLYFDFYYFGKRVEKSTGWPDNKENRVKAREALNLLIKKLENGTLSFAQVFPKASEKEKAFFSMLENRSYSRCAIRFFWTGNPVLTGQRFRFYLDSGFLFFFLP